MSLISRKKTTESYFEKISSEPESTIREKQLVARQFTEFLNEKHSLTPEAFAEELYNIKNQKGDEEFTDTLYYILQQWINYCITRKLGSNTIQVRFSNLRGYLYHLGIRTDMQDVKQLLKFPKKVKEERYPLKRSELQSLVNTQARNPMRQALILALSSSGMRIGEGVSVLKSDLVFGGKRIMIRIRPENTKTKSARTTFISKECEDKIRTYLDTLAENDRVFTQSKCKKAVQLEQNALRRALARLNLTERYTSNGFRKISTHSLRAYFFTNATRKMGENYAHRLTGHGGYLPQYDRMTDDDKLKMYLELEPDLVIFDQTKNELEIERLKEETESIKELREEVKKLRENQARQDKKILDDMRGQGILPDLAARP
jgi:integrase/recombinase XerD